MQVENFNESLFLCVINKEFKKNRCISLEVKDRIYIIPYTVYVITFSSAHDESNHVPINLLDSQTKTTIERYSCVVLKYNRFHDISEANYLVLL